MFLFTDGHVVEEGFLEFINNMLTTGMQPALFATDEKDAMINKIRDQAKADGCMENPEALWNYFVGVCRNNLHIVLAMSPSGDALRVRCRNFPGLVSACVIDTQADGCMENPEALWNYFVGVCRNNLHIVLAMSPSGDALRVRCRNFPGLVSACVIDWFFAWPADALEKVATFFLSEVSERSELALMKTSIAYIFALESREMAQNIMATSTTKLTLYYSTQFF